VLDPQQVAKLCPHLHIQASVRPVLTWNPRAGVCTCCTGNGRDTSAANGVPRQPAGVPGGGYAGVNGRAQQQHSPPGSTVIYTDDEDDDEDADEFIQDDRCGHGASVLLIR